uniref:GNAT family N-acetyltransferase n=1 Tax=Castellaniella defragrans TaxID=75697 RepID=UPI003340F80A
MLAFALGDDAPGAVPARDAAAARVVVGAWEDLGPEAALVRTEVFVHEQYVPPEIELDDIETQCIHAVAYGADGRAVGTGRLLPDGHIGRMAVRAPWRGQGVGSLLLTALMAEARRRGDAQVVLAAQLQARPFYARHGFVAEGGTFMDAGIPHVLMRCHFADAG